jgi:hypothetical protein
MKNYIGFSNDHSGSMRGIARAAARDFNATVSAVQQAALANNIDTIVNVVQCGVYKNHRESAIVARQIVNSNVQVLKPIPESNYVADGTATPLYDSVGELIEILKAVPDYNDPEVTFLVFVTTDGGENSSRKWSGRTIGEEIKRLQMTDRWTFVFRVPRGGARSLMQQGIPEGNIQEWDQSERGFQVSTQATTQAFDDFYAGRTRGVKSTSTFYTSMKNVSAAEVKAQLKDISGEVTMWSVLSTENNAEIRPFVEAKLKKPMLKGAAFYQLTKTESKVQDTKMIVVREKKTGSVYFGAAARQMLGLPTYGNARVVPGDNGDWDVFVQSTSVNRKLMGGTLVMYWPNVGKAFTEGPSYQPSTAAAVQQQVQAVQASQVPAAPAPTKVAAATQTSGKITLVRKKDGVFVKDVNTIAEANEEIAKAKRGKKAALVIKQ